MAGIATGSLQSNGSVALAKPATDTQGKIQISGTYGTVTFVVEGSLDNVNYASLASIREDTNALVPGGVAIAPADNATLCVRVPGCDLYTTLRARVTAISSGTATFTVSTNALGAPGSSLAVSVTPQTNTAAKNTAVTTVGAGTLTAAALIGQLITRSGPVAAFTDTTDTAALIIAGVPAYNINQSWPVVIKNTTAFAQTLAAGTNVTLSGQTVIPPNSVGTFLLTITSSTAVTILGQSVGPLTTNPLQATTALNTVGAGTITAAGIAGGITTRGGAQAGAAFTDTTDTAANLIAALPNANIGQSFLYTYQNNTNATATLAGGTGLTVSAITIIPGGTWAEYLVTYTAAATVTMVGVAMGSNSQLPAAKFVSSAVSNGTASVGDITGAQFSCLTLTAAGANAYTLRTATQIFGDIPNAQAGQSYMVRITNTGSGTVTVTTATGVTLTGTMTIATNTFRDFVLTLNSATTVTLQSVAVGTIS